MLLVRSHYAEREHLYPRLKYLQISDGHNDVAFDLFIPGVPEKSPTFDLM